MRMQMHQRVGAAFLLDAAHEVIRGLRLEQAGHILDADGIDAHLPQALRHLDEGRDSVEGADRIANRALGMLAGFPHCGDAGLEIAQVIECVEDPEDIHAVGGSLLDETLDDPIFVMPIAEQILPAQQHLQARLRHQLAKGAQPLPRILVEEADAGIEGRAAPAFDRPVAGVIEVLAHRDHIFERHPRREETLMRIAEGQFGNFDETCHDADSNGKTINKLCWKGSAIPEVGSNRGGAMREIDEQSHRMRIYLRDDRSDGCSLVKLASSVEEEALCALNSRAGVSVDQWRIRINRSRSRRSQLLRMK